MPQIWKDGYGCQTDAVRTNVDSDESMDSMVYTEEERM